MLRNGFYVIQRRYADPDKFYNAFIRTFGEDNHFIKSIKSGKKNWI